MNITLSSELKDYMQKKGYVAITLGLAESGTCCSGFADVATGFVNARGFDAAAKQARAQLDAEGVPVLVTARGLEFADEVVLGLKSFLGVKDITAQGVKAFSL